jgi:hypothetical protein
VPNDGEISCEHVGALTANQYRCGAVYAMHIRVAGAISLGGMGALPGAS